MPENPLSDDAVIVEVPGDPAKNVRELGLPTSVKSTTLTVIATACVREPLVPVNVIVYVPGVEEFSVQVELAVLFTVSERLVGMQFTGSPVVGETVEVRETVPANPLTLCNVTTEDAELPADRVMDVGLAEMLKSTTVT